MINYKNLNGYKKAKEIVVKTYNLLEKVPNKEKYGLIGQISRCAVSIGSNFCEGYAYDSKQRNHFLKISLGSLNELEFQLEILNDIYKISDVSIYDLINEEKRILIGIINKG